MLLRGLTLAAAIMSATAISATAAFARTGNEPGGINIQLNKLAQTGNACRAYLVSQNQTETAFDSLKLDLVMFDKKGIVAKRLAVQIGPMPAGKTSLKVFDISGLKCANIGQLLLNDVLECTVPAPSSADHQSGAAKTAANGDTPKAGQWLSVTAKNARTRHGCLSLIHVSQRGKVPFIE